MKKLLVVAALAGTAVVGWRWQHEPASATDGARRGTLVANRFWIDHLPQGEKDTVRVFALWAPESFGVFADRNHWRVELERFRYETKGDTVHAVFPLSGAREDITLNASRCHEADWDFCLEVRGSSHGTTRYYSRLGWERRDRSVEQFMADVTARAR
jgi:hypothetical protein